MKALTFCPVLFCLALLPSISLAAQPSSARDCTPVLAKDYYSYAMKNNLQEDFLRSIDSDSYSQAKEEINSNGSAYGGAFTGSNDYNKFSEARDKYLESVHYSRNQQQALDILQITTSDRAYAAYEALWSVNIQSVTGGREEVFVMQSTKDRVRTDGV
jgi:hypothetical protein